jgi:hypothetical protein
MSARQRLEVRVRRQRILVRISTGCYKTAPEKDATGRGFRKSARFNAMKFLKIFLIFATVAFLGYVTFIVWFGLEWAKGEERAQQRREDLRSGKEDFGDQPALFAVAPAAAPVLRAMLDGGGDPNGRDEERSAYSRKLARELLHRQPEPRAARSSPGSRRRHPHYHARNRMVLCLLHCSALPDEHGVR